jgi:murein DD-endopeptidase MepM/ murein hydrolase activator NlpD
MEPKLTWPIKADAKISFKFGENPEWYLKMFGYPHNGIDIACPIGTPIYPCDKGVVSFADDVPDSGGKGLIISHTWGISLYWHLNVVYAEYGDSCDPGKVIGLSGATGYVTGPHLHFGIKVNGVETPGMRGWSDPMRWTSDNPPTPGLPLPVMRKYRVLPGDTLWGIAEKFYSNGLEWRRIYDANKERIKNPNLIFPFIVLMIP